MENVKCEILKVAGELFYQFGIRSVSIDDICKRLGISKKTFYLYYRQKEDLLDALSETMTEKFRQVMEETLRKQEPLDILKMVVSKAISFDTMKMLPQYTYDIQKYYPNMLERQKKRLAALNGEYLARCLHKGIETGVFRESLDVEECVEICNFMMLHLMDVQMGVVQVDKTKLKRRVNFMMDMLVRGVVK